MIQYHTNETGNLSECDWDELSVDVLDTFGIDVASLDSDLNQSDKLVNHINDKAKEILEYKKNSVPDGAFENFQKVEKPTMRTHVDAYLPSMRPSDATKRAGCAGNVKETAERIF